jgi:hypothetical protein
VPLHLLDVLQQVPLGQLHLGVLEAVGKHVRGAALGRTGVDAVAHGLGGGWWLTGKAVQHGLHGGRLVGLGLELELHPGLLSAVRGLSASSLQRAAGRIT